MMTAAAFARTVRLPALLTRHTRHLLPATLPRNLHSPADGEDAPPAQSDRLSAIDLSQLTSALKRAALAPSSLTGDDPSVPYPYEQGAQPPAAAFAASNSRYTRQYFYFINHLGYLYLDDVKIKNFVTGFKDKVFLDFFFKRLRRNTVGIYHDVFPYVSLCGRELNFVRVEDRPIVFHTLTDDDKLIYAGTLSVPFDPAAVVMSAETGRIYHPAPFESPGLLCSAICIELGKSITFEAQDTASKGVLTYKGRQYEIGVIA